MKLLDPVASLCLVALLPAVLSIRTAWMQECGYPSDPSKWVDPPPMLGFQRFLERVSFFDEINPIWWAWDCSLNDIRPGKQWNGRCVNNATIVEAARRNNVRIILSINGDVPRECVDSQIKPTLSDPARRARHIAKLVDIAVANNYDGIELDYEHFQNSDRAMLTTFIREWCSAMHARNKKCAWAVNTISAPGPTYWDYPVVSNLLDEMHVMHYDFHGWVDGRMYPHPGPISWSSWVNASVNYMKKIGSNMKHIVIGLPAYGLHNTKGPCDISDCAHKFCPGGNYQVTSQHCLNCNFVPSGERWPCNRTPNCDNGQAWFDDVQSWEESVKIIGASGAAGVSWFLLPGEPVGVYDMIPKYINKGV